MSFHICIAKNGKTFDIVEDRRLKYFSRYSRYSRMNVKYIVIDMYAPYISLIKMMFPDAQIVIDKFHLIQLISRALNKTRIRVMKKNKDNYNKLKNYWKNILKSRFELDCSSWKRYKCFKELTTEQDIVDYIKNNFNTKYHNGYIEGNINFIKALKIIAFGFRSFIRFKARIMICKGLINPKEKEVENLSFSTS